MELIDDHGFARERQSGLALSPSSELRAILDVHAHPDATSRIAHHWVGGVPSIQEWELPRSIGRLVTAAIPRFLEADKLKVHGIMGEEGKPPEFETITIESRNIRAPMKVGYFLENIGSAERFMLTVDRDGMGDRQVGVVARDAGEWLNRLRQFATQNNFLRGRIFDLAGEIVTISGIDLDDIILTPEQDRAVRLHILGFRRLMDKVVAVGGRRQRGIYLEGPPGCGKSMFLRAVARHMAGMSVCLASPNQISGMRGIEDLQMLLEMTAPCAIFLEEIDIFGKDRSLAHSPAMAELMQLMDGLRNIPGLLWVATTNRPEEVEQALADRPGRFDRKISFRPLEGEYHQRLVEKLARPSTLTSEAMTLMGEQTEGFSGAQIREICDTMRLIAIDQALNTDVFDVGLVRQAIIDCRFEKHNGFGFSPARKLTEADMSKDEIAF